MTHIQFNKSKEAKQKSENAQIKEETTLGDYENKIEQYKKGENAVGEYIDGSREDTDLSDYKIVSLIPNMTSDNQPSGTVDASSEVSGRDSYNAFAGIMPNPYTGTGYWFSFYNNSWLSYTWENEVNIGRIEFYQKSENKFKIQYLDNGNWKDISTTTGGEVSDIYVEKIIEFPIIKTNAIRFYCTYVAGETSTTGCAMGNVKVYGLEKVK